MTLPDVVILGGGPAGLGAAYQLRRLDRARVTVLERQTSVGGNAGSFSFGGQNLDYGSHRLHPSCDPAILEDIRGFLGDDLLDRPRHGRIRLRGRWVHFPLKVQDLLIRLDPLFACGVARDIVLKPLRRHSAGDTFESVLLGSLGPMICHGFYFPYAKKIWGLPLDRLSEIQAKRRVSAASFGKLAKKILGQIPGMKPPGAGRFYYPRTGFGGISEAYARAATGAGATIRLESTVEKLVPPGGPGQKWQITVATGGTTSTLEADYVWSTIPVTILARLLGDTVPKKVLEASASMRYRAMLLVYLTLPTKQYTEYDAHYFPELEINITRLSEPKNYADLSEPNGQTTLCAELPCARRDRVWEMSDSELAQIVCDDLDKAGLPTPATPLAVTVKRLPQAYPIYEKGFAEPYERLLDCLDDVPGLLTFGRQGLFAHDNTHHALYMAYCAADCLADKHFNSEQWNEYRHIFETHVVED